MKSLMPNQAAPTSRTSSGQGAVRQAGVEASMTWHYYPFADEGVEASWLGNFVAPFADEGVEASMLNWMLPFADEGVEASMLNWMLPFADEGVEASIIAEPWIPIAS